MIDEVVKGNGLDKVDKRIEDAFESSRPMSSLSRRDAIFCRAVPDFFMCGIGKGYIYRVTSEAASEIHDLSWLKEPQMALNKQKHIEKYPIGMFEYPDWTDELLETCSRGYWSGAQTEAPIWEHLVPDVKVIELLSDTMVDVKDTVGGWG